MTGSPDPTSWEDLIRRLTYKEGYSFEVREEDFGLQGKSATITMFTPSLPNSEDPDGPPSRATYWIKCPHPFILSPALVVLRDMIHRYELHESDEWLKIDGDWVKNPHGKESWWDRLRKK